MVYLQERIYEGNYRAGNKVQNIGCPPDIFLLSATILSCPPKNRKKSESMILIMTAIFNCLTVK